VPEERPNGAAALVGAVIPGSDELDIPPEYINKYMIIKDLLDLLHAYFTVTVSQANIRRNQDG
jgi:hypothetical protein